jgi:probable F420-dependent oxidoreductase
VLLLPQRHPVQLAKELATLDVVSDGRLVVGVGIGHLEREMQAVGVDPANREALALEHLAAMRALWTMTHPVFDGPTVRFSDVDAHPRPTRPQGPPIVMGGWSRAALRRAAEHADGWYAWGLDPAEVEVAVATLHSEATSFGRDLDDFRVSVTPLRRLTRMLVEDYAAVCVDQLVVAVEAEDIDGVRRRLERNAPENYGIND